MTKRLKLVFAVAGALAVVGLAIWFNPFPNRPCQTGEYSRLVGVGVDVQLEQVKALQSKLGLSDSLVRGLDTILRDYSAKYDNACRDVTQKLITVAQYQCMRQQIDRNLDSARRVSQALDAAKSGSDPEAQRKILQAALEELQRARDDGFGGSCIPGLEVSPKQVSFKGSNSVAFFTLLNRGQLPLTYSITDCPDGFMPRKLTGTVAPAGHDDIVIHRTLDPLPAKRPLHAVIKVGSRPDLPVEFVVDSQNARLWQDLASGLRESGTAEPSLASALDVIDRTIPTGVDVAAGDRHALAAGALFAAGFHAQSQNALRQALNEDKRLAQTSSVLRLSALLAAERPDAQKLYVEVRAAQPTFEQSTGAATTTVDLGKIQFTQQVATASGQVLSPGVYEIRLTEGVKADASWIEFLQNNAVKGRDVAAPVPDGMFGVRVGKHLQKVERDALTNVWLDAGNTKYVVNLTTCANLPKCGA